MMKKSDIKLVACSIAFAMMLLHAFIPHHHHEHDMWESHHCCNHIHSHDQLADLPEATHYACHVTDFWKPTKQQELVPLFALISTLLLDHQQQDIQSDQNTLYYTKAYKPPKLRFKQLRAPPIS